MHPRTHDDLSDGEIRRLMDYTAAACRMTSGRYDSCIPALVADEWSLTGRCVFSTNAFSKRYGVTRRTVCKALKRLEEAGVIRNLGRTDDGRSILEPCIEIGDSWRARREADHAGR